MTRRGLSLTTTTADPDDYVRRVQSALQARDLQGALKLALEAERAWPSHPEVKLQRALTLRVMGDLHGAVAALDEVLALDAYHHLALLSKASLVEKLSGERTAAALYRSALKLAPTEPPMPLKPVIEHARRVVTRTDEALDAHLRERVGRLDVDCPEAARRRFEEAWPSPPARLASIIRSRCSCTIRGCPRSPSTTVRRSRGCPSWRPPPTPSAASSRAPSPPRTTISPLTSPSRRARR